MRKGITKYKLKLGQKFNRWKVIGKPYISSRHTAVCLFICDCGYQGVRSCYRIVSGVSHSCGCYKADRHRTHGQSNTRIHRRWRNMMSRCYDINHISYTYYGERGIKVCKRWHVFENFYKDMGDIPNGMTLDRIDNNAGYSKNNCKWSTHSEQNYNKRSRR